MGARGPAAHARRLADRPPVRLGRAKPPHKHDVPNLFGSKKQETEIFERLKAAAVQGASTSSYSAATRAVENEPS